MSDAFESERLRILEKVSSGEITPQEGQLQIAMLKVKHQEPAATEADEDATGMQSAEGAWRRQEEAFRERFAGFGAPANFKLTLPLMIMLAIPALVIAGFFLTAMAVVLAIPTLLLVLTWNAIASAMPGAMPTLAFFPTLGAMVLAFLLLSVVRGWWRTRLLVNMARRGR